ncbi:MAG: hypothetical protein IPO21_03745 [Bacteroidales bacterium]|nr:hypothetical protein [Bacteroidales bacterium]
MEKSKNVFSRIIARIDSRFIAFAIFLIISAFFWFLNALEKQYSFTMNIPIKYDNIPTNKIITNELPKEFKVRGKAYGFALIKQHLDVYTEPVVIDVKKYASFIDRNKYIFLPNKQHEIFESKINSDFMIDNILPDTINFHFSIVHTKKVPVKSNIQVAFRNQFQLKNEVSFIPDCVEIATSKKFIDSIKYIETNELILSDLFEDTRLSISLKENTNIKITTKEVLATVEVEKFTEKILKIPIKKINTPSNFIVSLSEDYVYIKFYVGLSKYYDYNADNFDVFVNCDSIKYKPQVLDIQVNTPYGVSLVSVNPTKIDYILKIN